MTRMPRPLWPIVVLLSIASSTACAPKTPEPRVVTRIERVPILHPPALLKCAPEPPVPGRPRTVAEALGWIADLRAAGQDCRSRLACIRARQDSSETCAEGDA